MYGVDENGRIKLIQKVSADNVDLDGTGEIVVDQDGDSKIYSTVDDEVIHSVGGSQAFTTKSVGIGMPSGKDIYPGGQSTGLGLRMDRMFTAGNPAHSYNFTARQFKVNDTAHVCGFEDSQSSPYSFTSSKFTGTVPANTELLSNLSAHHLTMWNKSGSGCQVQWTDTTARNNCRIALATSALWTASDYLLAGIRFWAVQSPGASDKYFEVRLNWMGSTYSSHPMRIGMWYGTGVTWAYNNGTLVQLQVPMTDMALYNLLLQNVATSAFYCTPRLSEGQQGTGISASPAGWPSSFKTMRIYLGINWTQLHIDEITIS